MQIIESPITIMDVAIIGVIYEPEPDPADLFDLPAWLTCAVPERQASYLAGRKAAALAIERAGRAPMPVGIGPDRGPLWPETLSGSISHSLPLAFAAVAATRCFARIGIDVEAVQSEGAAKILTPKVVQETEALLARAVHPPGVAETLIFSAKEAIFKAAPQAGRRSLRFNSANLAAIDECTLRFSLINATSCFGVESLHVRYALLDTHVLTLCVQKTSS